MIWDLRKLIRCEANLVNIWSC